MNKFPKVEIVSVAMQPGIPKKCPYCGHHELIRKGRRVLKSGAIVHSFQCRRCHKRHTPNRHRQYFPKYYPGFGFGV